MQNCRRFLLPKTNIANLPKKQRSNAVVADDDPLFQALRTLRAKIAAKKKVPAYVVFADAALRDMCAKKPQTREEFLQVSGVGERKLVQYGETFLKEIRKHLQNAEEEND